MKTIALNFLAYAGIMLSCLTVAMCVGWLFHFIFGGWLTIPVRNTRVFRWVNLIPRRFRSKK